MKDGKIFYGRSAAGAYPLDVSELKEIFEMVEALPNRVNRFINGQLLKVSGSARPIPMAPLMLPLRQYHAPKVVFHLIPASAFSGNLRLDIGINRPELQDFFPLESCTPDMTGPSPNHRMNLEGWVNYGSFENEVTASYTQVYRNGIVEAVDTMEVGISPGSKETRGALSSGYEVKLQSALPHYVKILSKLGIESPFYLSLCLINVGSWYLKREKHVRSKFAFDFDNVVIPPIICSEPGFNTDAALLDLFNIHMVDHPNLVSEDALSPLS